MGEKENQIIDYEWMFDFPVPVNFIMWRLIHELYTHIPELPRLCHEDEMMAEFDISYTDYEIFMNWTMHFVYEYVGCGSLIPFEQKKSAGFRNRAGEQRKRKAPDAQQDVL